MAGLAPRVHYLAGFSCPAGGLTAGGPRVLHLGAEVFLAAGRELVYVYDREARQLTAVYRFPGPVWHLEALALRRALLVLCARRGIYCLSLDQARRSVSQSDGDDEDSEAAAPVTPVDPDTCVLPDATLCAFTVLGDLLVALAQGPAQWKVQLFECPSPGEDPGPRGQIGEVELSTHTPPAGSPGKSQAPHFRPVLCCVSLPSSRARHSPAQGPRAFTLEGPLFGLLFGADAALLESPVILCGLPDGQLCSVVLKTLVTSRSAPGDPKALVRILHHLEEPVAFIGALRTEPSAEGPEDADLDCLVALGHHGRTLAIKASWDEAGSLVPELREYCLPGPVLCAACSGDSHVYHSTPSGLCVVDLARGGPPEDPVQPDGPGGLPPLLCPTSLGVCSVVTLSVSSRSPAGGTELLALSAKGRLMTCCLDLSREPPRPTRVTAADTGRKIKDLLCGIGTVSERVSSLKKAVDQRNRALTCLNEAMNVSCALLASREGARPVSCTTTTAWSRRELQDVLTATCLLENSSGFRLDRGWALCVQVLPGSHASDSGSAVTYTVPVDQLGPGDRREVTLLLGPGADGTLDLPVTVSCALFLSLREVVGGALAPSDPFEDPSLDGCPPDVLPEQGGICLPLSEHTVDMLQGLRFPGLAAPPVQAPAPCHPPGDPVSTFLETCWRPGSEPVRPESLRAKYLPPSVAAIRVSAELLRAALGGSYSGVSLCCATLQWLLAQNAAVDAVRARALTSVQAVAPDGTEIRLIVHEASRAGPPVSGEAASLGALVAWVVPCGHAGVRQGHGCHLVLERVPQEQVLPQRGADAVGRWPVLGGSCRWAETSFAQEGGGQPARSWHEAPLCCRWRWLTCARRGPSRPWRSRWRARRWPTCAGPTTLSSGACRGWWWSRPPRAPAHPTSACSISTRSRPTTRRCCGRCRPCGTGCAQRTRPAPRPRPSVSCRCTSSSAAPASSCCEQLPWARPQPSLLAASPGAGAGSASSPPRRSSGSGVAWAAIGGHGAGSGPGRAGPPGCRCSWGHCPSTCLVAHPGALALPQHRWSSRGGSL